MDKAADIAKSRNRSSGSCSTVQRGHAFSIGTRIRDRAIRKGWRWWSISGSGIGRCLLRHARHQRRQPNWVRRKFNVVQRLLRSS